MTRIPFAKIPEQLMACMMKTENYLAELNTLDYPLKELLHFHVSTINKCAYCIDMHFKQAVAAGETEIRLYSSQVWRQTSFYSEPEKALLAWAESVTLLSESNEQRQSDYDNLLQHFSQEDVANITLSIVQINAWNRIAKSFGFEAGTYQVGQHG